MLLYRSISIWYENEKKCIDNSTDSYYYVFMVRIRTDGMERSYKIREQIKLVNIALSGTLDVYRIWAKKYNLNYNALVVLYTLHDYKVCTQKQICEWWALPKQTVHGILLDFEKKGYLNICANAENKRERLITFTERGTEFASSVLEPLLSMEEHAMLQLGEEKRQQLIDTNMEYYELLKQEIEHG